MSATPHRKDALFTSVVLLSLLLATAGAWWHVAAPLVIAVLLVVSWALRPESRRLPGATIRGLGMRPS